MFRYIALAWQPDRMGSSTLAEALLGSMTAAPGWRLEARHPRLAVFATECAPGNQAYPLQSQRGVVLGRQFQRPEPLAHGKGTVNVRAAVGARAARDVKDLLDHHWGRYVAFFETEDGQPMVLRDPSGALPCFALQHSGVTVVFSWLADVQHLLPTLPSHPICQEGLATFLAVGQLSGRRTALKGVWQILAGECVPLAPFGEADADRSWNASAIAASPIDLDLDVARNQLRETVRSCVQAWSETYRSIVLRLSGGIDSAIVAACLASGHTTARVTCLNYHSAGSNSDERAFARLAAAAARLELIERSRDARFRLDAVLDVARTPVPTHYVGRLTSRANVEAADLVGAQAMFSGAGGDQLFFEVPQWWPAADYLRTRGFDGGFFSTALDAARLGRVSVWRAMRLALIDRFRQDPPHVDVRRSRTLVSNEVLHQAARPDGLVHPALASRSNLPIGKLVQVQQLTYAPSYYDPYARDRAPELVNPLLSQPVMELCLKLPTYVLTHGGRGRALARDAFKDELPAAIFSRRSKGGMGSYFESLLSANLDFARQILLDGELVRWGLLDRKAVEKALSGRHPGQVTPAGEVHLAIGAEAWVQATLAEKNSSQARLR